MQKLALGVLAFLVIALAAMNTRLRDRERILDERLATAEKRAARKPSRVIPLDPAPPPAKPVPTEEPPKPAAVVVPEPAPAPDLKLEINTVSYTASVAALGESVGSLSFKLSEADLNLTDAQRSLIEAAKARTEQYIRDLLTPEQRKTYDDRQAGQFDFQWVKASELVMPEGWKAGYLGITGGDAAGGGAQVSEVRNNTPASAAGLQPGDVVLDVNGDPVSNLSDLTKKIRRTGEGFAATLRIRRGGVEFILPVQLGNVPK